MPWWWPFSSEPKQKVMGITGGTGKGQVFYSGGHIENNAMSAATRAWDKGWRVSTLGNGNAVNEAVIWAAIEGGQCNNLDIYVQSGMNSAGFGDKEIVLKAKAQGANIIEYAGNSQQAFNNTNNKILLERNFINECDAVNLFGNNNSESVSRMSNYAKNHEVPQKLNSYLGGLYRSATILNCFGVLLGAVGLAFDWADLGKYLDNINKLLEKYRNGETTEEENKFLLDSGAILMSDAGEINESNMDGIVLVSGSNRGNPYHDRNGKFCSASEAVTVSV